MKFPSVQKITELNQFNNFNLVGERAEVVVSRCPPENLAAFKLTSVWVRVCGVPDDLMNYNGFCLVGSLLGTVQELDMPTYRKMEIVRIKVGVMDHTKIPEWSPLTVDPHIYKIYFQIEKVVEMEGPLIGGIPIQRGPAQSNKAQDRGVDRELKRQKRHV